MEIPLARPDIGEGEIQAVLETLKSGWVTQGKKVAAFESAFAHYCGTKHGVAACNGTAALHIALAALGVTRGDEVITTPLSCVATTNPLLYLGAKPVFVDVEPTTLNLDPARIEERMTRHTKAILPVHLFGHPVDVDPLLEIAEKHGLYVIEDAAQAHGARYKGKRVGSFGHIACFSFYADKLLTTVEGGMALTNDAELAETMRSLRSFGMTRHEKFQHPVLGFNYKMSDLHAAIGLVQLQKLDAYIEQRRRNIRFLTAQLTHPNLKFPLELDYAFNVYYTCHILAEKGRAEIVRHLEQQGIETRPLLSFIPDQPPYKHDNDPSACPIAREAHQNGFYISNSPLLALEELEFMVAALRDAVATVEK